MHYGFKTKYWPIFADILQFPFCDRKKIVDILSAKTLDLSKYVTTNNQIMP